MNTLSKVKSEAKELKHQVDLENQVIKKKLFVESNAGDGTTTSEQHLTGMKLVLCLISCYLSTFLIQLDQTIVVTILETVGNKFNAFEKVGWLSSGYMLSMSVFAVTWGRLSIIFGRKWALILAIVLFEAGSLVSALSQDMNTLIGGRVLSGIGGGGVLTLAIVIGSELTTIDKRPLIMASFGVAGAVSTVAGPLIGGAFSENGLWRWCFYINLPIGGLAIVALYLVFHPPMPKFSWRQKFLMIDYVGTAFLAAGIVLILLGFTCGGNEFKWRSAAIILFFILGALCLVAFGVWNTKYSSCPTIPTAIFQTPKVLVSITAGGLVLFCFMGSLVYVTVYFQIVKGKSAWKSGISLIPLILSTILSSIISGVLTKRFRYIKPLAIFASVCGCVGLGVMSLLDENSSSSETIGLLILPGIYSGTLFQTLMISSHIEAPKEPGSTIVVTSLMNCLRSLGGALGADIGQLVFNNSFKSLITKGIKSAKDTELSVSTATLVLSKPGLINNYDAADKQLLYHSFVQSFRNVCYLFTGFACLSLILVLFMSNKKLPKSDEVAKDNKQVLPGDIDHEQDQAQHEEKEGEKSIQTTSEH